MGRDTLIKKYLTFLLKYAMLMFFVSTRQLQRRKGAAPKKGEEILC